jgi:hypothetical protein
MPARARFRARRWSPSLINTRGSAPAGHRGQPGQRARQARSPGGARLLAHSHGGDTRRGQGQRAARPIGSRLGSGLRLVSQEHEFTESAASYYSAPTYSSMWGGYWATAGRASTTRVCPDGQGHARRSARLQPGAEQARLGWREQDHETPRAPTPWSSNSSTRWRAS